MPSDGSGLGSAPGAFMVATEPESYDSGDNFEYRGKYEGKVYNASTKPNSATYLYPPVPAFSCLGVSIGQDGNTAPPPTMHNHSTNALPPDPGEVLTISLPKHIMVLLQDLPAHSIAMPFINGQCISRVLIANTGATNHMLPNKRAFIS
jgi:hypothetical protein